ncbi:hypothetical protein TNCV_1837821 [Trichonephila clavipes]|nr:hypothetical protein TNCV_1837821 [Trichonephila clavipes]
MFSSEESLGVIMGPLSLSKRAIMFDVDCLSDIPTSMSSKEVLWQTITQAQSSLNWLLSSKVIELVDLKTCHVEGMIPMLPDRNPIEHARAPLYTELELDDQLQWPSIS